MNNTSVQGNYTSYTTPETLITLDVNSQNNKISVAKGWTGSTGNDAVTAWIDFDRNGQFTDAENFNFCSQYNYTGYGYICSSFNSLYRTIDYNNESSTETFKCSCNVSECCGWRS
jgi:hypothetical protein